MSTTMSETTCTFFRATNLHSMRSCSITNRTESFHGRKRLPAMFSEKSSRFPGITQACRYLGAQCMTVETNFEHLRCVFSSSSYCSQVSCTSQRALETIEMPRNSEAFQIRFGTRLSPWLRWGMATWCPRQCGEKYWEVIALYVELLFCMFSNTHCCRAF